MTHEREHYLLVILEVVLDKLIELCLLGLPVLLLLLFLPSTQVTYWKLSFCSLALDFTFSSEVSLRFTFSTFFTVLSSFCFMKFMRACTA